VLAVCDEDDHLAGCLSTLIEVFHSGVDRTGLYATEVGATAKPFRNEEPLAVDHLQVISERPGPTRLSIKHQDTDAVSLTLQIAIADKAQDGRLSGIDAAMSDPTIRIVRVRNRLGHHRQLLVELGIAVLGRRNLPLEQTTHRSGDIDANDN